MRRVVPQPCARLVARTPQPRMRLPAGQRRYSTESESLIFEVNRAGRVDELRRSIAAQPVERLPLTEFRKMAEKAGLSADEATGALDALHRSGSVLYLPSEVPDVVFTRPAAVRAAILNVIDPTGEVRLCLPLRIMFDQADLCAARQGPHGPAPRRSGQDRGRAEASRGEAGRAAQEGSALCSPMGVVRRRVPHAAGGGRGAPHVVGVLLGHHGGDVHRSPIRTERRDRVIRVYVCK